MTDKERMVRGLNLIAEGIAEVALAYEQSESGRSASAATRPPMAEVSAAPADTFSDGTPIEEPFMEEVDPIAPVLAATGGTEVTPPAQVMWGDGGVCPDHTRPWKAVPAGVSSRTGKSYRAFWACPENFCKQRPEGEWVKQHSAAKAAAA